MRSKLKALPFVLFLLPFDFIVAFAVLAAALCASVTLWFKTHRRGDTETQRADSSRAAIVILNWDGKPLLEECLPSVLDAVRHEGGGHEVLVVDNGSTDGSVDFVRSRFPAVRILPLDRNYGFAGGNNRGAAEVESDIIVFLNNDMVVDRLFLRPLLEGFSDPSVFAVTSQIFFADPKQRREETGKTRARFQAGFVELRHDELSETDEQAPAIPVFWAGGGSCAFDRRKFFRIGGFDTLYSPFYVEDTDLSYHAWKRGWKCLLAPASRVVHKHRGTSRPRFGDRFVDNTIRKNLYLFVWKNITDPSMIVEHLVHLPRIHARAISRYGPGFETRAFFRALRRLPEALLKRVASRSEYVRDDEEVFAQSHK
jgi:GT2 family glycosyltransferase